MLRFLLIGFGILQLCVSAFDLSGCVSNGRTAECNDLCSPVLRLDAGSLRSIVFHGGSADFRCVATYPFLKQVKLVQKTNCLNLELITFDVDSTFCLPKNEFPATKDTRKSTNKKIDEQKAALSISTELPMVFMEAKKNAEGHLDQQREAGEKNAKHKTSKIITEDPKRLESFDEKDKNIQVSSKNHVQNKVEYPSFVDIFGKMKNMTNHQGLHNKNISSVIKLQQQKLEKEEQKTEQHSTSLPAFVDEKNQIIFRNKSKEVVKETATEHLLHVVETTTKKKESSHQEQWMAHLVWIAPLVAFCCLMLIGTLFICWLRKRGRRSSSPGHDMARFAARRRMQSDVDDFIMNPSFGCQNMVSASDPRPMIPLTSFVDEGRTVQTATIRRATLPMTRHTRNLLRVTIGSDGNQMEETDV